MQMLKVFILLLIIVLSLYVFVQNADEYVDIDLFHATFPEQSLTIILFASTVIGIVVGFLLAAVQYLQAKAEAHHYKRDNIRMRQELDKMRNLTLEDISFDETEKSSPAVTSETSEEKV